MRDGDMSYGNVYEMITVQRISLHLNSSVYKARSISKSSNFRLSSGQTQISNKESHQIVCRSQRIPIYFNITAKVVCRDYCHILT